MKLIGIDSSGLVASVAIVEDDLLIAEYTVEHKKTHSTTLMPMLNEIVKMSETDLKEVGAIAIAAGPGSFTGLRIGSATAKGLAYSLNIPIIPVPTLAALAYNIQFFDGIICPIMDARREQVYNGLYSFSDGEFTEIKADRALAVEELINELNSEYLGKKVVFLGDGVPVYKNIIEERLELQHFYATANISKQRAGSVAVLGKMYYNRGVAETAESHEPIYLRLSQAERERKEKEQADK
ncbi:MAG: tRNA (adenosine(37)-N6)-threonylcarbamoyltransferase complex dimerization subunit type 1 TsaB [Catonella sp.]|uniref:tRNA (adenosine(37)-N6)-threonylcarbamoyltransferase complex dimerization subunit type 1 TsaB n=1 Tax=Catonella sp. TaxID=2382125 RepID=UPI003FA0C688